MVPFFIIVMLIGAPMVASISGGSDWAIIMPSSGEMNSCGSMSILAMPRLALNQAPVALTCGKYFVRASRRCSRAASMSSCDWRMAMLRLRAESFSCWRVSTCWAAMTSQHTRQTRVAMIFFIVSLVC